MQHLESILNEKNKLWRYLVMTIVVFLSGNIIGAIPIGILSLIYISKTGHSPTIHDQMPDFSAIGTPSFISLAMLLFIFAVMCTTFTLMLKPLHNKSLKTVINGGKTFRWNRVLMGVSVWGIITLIGFGISLVTNPNNFVWQFHPADFFYLFLVVLLLLPFQTSFEELFFRGYLSQAIGKWTHNRWVTWLTVSLLFGLIHFSNPEVKAYGFAIMIPQYILMGMFLGLISILDDGIELALGVHFINNALGALLLTDKNSVFQTDALFKELKIDPICEFIYLIIFVSITFLFFQRIYKWKIFRTMNQRIELQQTDSSSIGNL